MTPDHNRASISMRMEVGAYAKSASASDSTRTAQAAFQSSGSVSVVSITRRRACPRVDEDGVGADEPDVGGPEGVRAVRVGRGLVGYVAEINVEFGGGPGHVRDEAVGPRPACATT